MNDSDIKFNSYFRLDIQVLSIKLTVLVKFASFSAGKISVSWSKTHFLNYVFGFFFNMLSVFVFYWSIIDTLH